MMRRFYLIVIALVLCFGCKKQTHELPANQMAIEIDPISDQAAVGVPSKADTFKPFVKGSKVGLYVVNYNKAGTVAGTLLNTGNHADNKCYIADDAGVLRITPVVFYPDAAVTEKVDIYAYYPFTDQMIKGVAACQFDVKVDQRLVADQMASDLCWAKNLRGSESTPITASPKPVAMEFVHKFSKIKLTINIPAISSTGKKVKAIADLKINGVYCSTTLNLATGVVALKNTATDSRSSITPQELQAGAPGTTAYIYDLILPAQAFEVGYSLVTFDLVFQDDTKGQVSYKVSDKTFGVNKNAAVAGKLNKIELTINPSFEIILSGSQIVDWSTNGADYSGVADNTVKTTFKVKVSPADISTVNRVVVKTDVDGDFDIKTGVTFGAGVCQFKFMAGVSPTDYGFRITSLQFFNGTTALTNEIVKSSARVYSTTDMDLGTWTSN